MIFYLATSLYELCLGLLRSIHIYLQAMYLNGLENFI